MKSIVFIFLLITTYANSQVTEYANFNLLENEEIIWRLVYNRPGASVDSLKAIIFNNISSDNALKIIEEGETELVAEMKEMIFEKNGDLFNGRVSFEVKDGKYRVTLSGVRRFFGVKTMRLANFGGVSNQVKNDNVGMRFEDTYLKKDGKSLTGMKGLEIYNKLFLPQFDYKSVRDSKKETDW